VHELFLAAALDQPGMRQDFKMMRNRRRRAPREVTIALEVISLFLAMASKISRRVSLANAFEILSILELSIKCLVTVPQPERVSVVART
jgi:hypothetical protein